LYALAVYVQLQKNQKMCRRIQSGIKNKLLSMYIHSTHKVRRMEILLASHNYRSSKILNFRQLKLVWRICTKYYWTNFILVLCSKRLL